MGSGSSFDSGVSGFRFPGVFRKGETELLALAFRWGGEQSKSQIEASRVLVCLPPTFPPSETGERSRLTGLTLLVPRGSLAEPRYVMWEKRSSKQQKASDHSGLSSIAEG